MLTMINTLLFQIRTWDLAATLQLGLASQRSWVYDLAVFGVSSMYWVWIACLAMSIFVYAYSGALIGSLHKRVEGIMHFAHQFIIGVGVFCSAYLVKYLTLVERPYVAIGNVLARVPAGMNAELSFPSAHATVFMYATCLLWLYKTPVWVKMLAVVMLVWITWSRVLVGYHFIVDVIVGYLLGFIGFLIAKKYSIH